jgi:phenylpyruvate tautomerase PptA (4-oxalocrotonate tautomerase family)
MPHIRCRGIEREKVVEFSEHLVEQLAELTKSPAAHFTIEYIPAEFIATRFGGHAYPFIELFWFDRGQNMQDAAAQLITSVVKAALGDVVDVAVVVNPIERTNYYDNGQHY